MLTRPFGFFQWLCTFVAVLLHYLYTASFTWMSAEGLHLYFKIVTVFNLERIKLIYYVVFCWGEYDSKLCMDHRNKIKVPDPVVKNLTKNKEPEANQETKQTSKKKEPSTIKKQC